MVSFDYFSHGDELTVYINICTCNKQRSGTCACIFEDIGEAEIWRESKALIQENRDVFLYGRKNEIWPKYSENAKPYHHFI